jgi:Ca-activated chloride channel family protein
MFYARCVPGAGVPILRGQTGGLSAPIRLSIVRAMQEVGVDRSSLTHPSRALGTTRRRLLAGIVGVWLLGAAGLLSGASPTAETVVVTHWANGWMMSEQLLPAFASEFNRAGHTTAAGKRIVVRPVVVNSGQISEALVDRIAHAAPFEEKLGAPTVVTPADEQWLAEVNQATGRTVFEPGQARPLAVTWVGIVTYRGMAECLGWPRQEVGFADVVELRSDPRGWARCPSAKAEWGRQPLLSFTDPSSSTTARSVLFALYGIAAGKPLGRLTPEDVAEPAVADYVRRFQRGVDHYVPDTLILNSKIALGPRYGHIFFAAESNLVQLYQGKVPVTVGADAKAQPLTQPMVFIYPKEGALEKNNPAAIVRADWVSGEHAEAAAAWVDFLREDARQRAFMADGFRPATGIPYVPPVGAQAGIDPSKPTTVFEVPRPETASAIVGAWEEVKKPGVATFVVDVSGSMAGDKISAARSGMVRAIDNTSQRNLVGLLTFGSGVKRRVPIAPLADNRFAIAEEIGRMEANGGGTHLYDAIREAIMMTDRAPGDPDSIRGVVVLTDGLSNGGTAGLEDLVTMVSRQEVPIRRFEEQGGGRSARDANGRAVPKPEVVGTGLAVQTRHPIHVFFVGVGKDADYEVGRIMAEATGAAFQGATEKDLAAVLEKFGKYF